MKKAVIVVLLAGILFGGCGGGAGGSESEREPEYVTVTFLYNYEGAPNNGVFKTETIEKGRRVTAPELYEVDRAAWTGTKLGWFEEYPSTVSPKEAGVKLFDFTKPVTADCTVYMRWNTGQKYFSNANDILKQTIIENLESVDMNVNSSFEQLFYENDRGDFIRVSMNGDTNRNNWILEISMTKFLDTPLVFGTVVAEGYIDKSFTENAGGVPTTVSLVSLPNQGNVYKFVWNYDTVGFITTGGNKSVPHSVDSTPIDELYIKSYSRDYIEIPTGGFWTPGRYYYQTKKRSAHQYQY